MESQERIPVTMGFVNRVCNECRDLPVDSHPAAAIHGHTSKIKRYYWREIAFRLQDLYEQLGGTPEGWLHEMCNSVSEIYKKAQQQALEDIKRLHATNPKYIYNIESSESVINEFNIKIRDMHAAYIHEGDKKVKIFHEGQSQTVEQYAESVYRSEGYEVLFLESMPFHVLFGVFTWLLIQDPFDPNVQICSFGERTAYEVDGSKVPIYTYLPSDFGSPSYAVRRGEKIFSHFELLRPDRDDLLWLFDYWLPGSEGLRQYLWAHRSEHIAKARLLIQILDPGSILKILQYLLSNYWDRYLGWPDILAFNSSGFIFVEVKSSKDKLSDEQKRWIKGNSQELHLPFEIFKVHRAMTQPN